VGMIEDGSMKATPVVFKYFRRYSKEGLLEEMWCYPNQQSFTVWFEKELLPDFYYPIAVLRVKKLKNLI